jgi:hypothetical protein
MIEPKIIVKNSMKITVVCRIDLHIKYINFLNINIMKFSNLQFTKRNYSDSAKIDLSNGKSIVILPTIDNGPEFRDQLLLLLNTLDKSSRYELEFSMYLRSNDDNKNLLDLPLPNYNLSPGNFIMTRVIFENTYKFKGYFGFITEKSLYKSKQDLIRFVSIFLAYYNPHKNV